MEEQKMEFIKARGVDINYYYICKRKLWLFNKGITMEDNNDRVLEGKVLHENSYKRMKSKEILIDNLIKIDIIDKEKIKEVKIYSKMEKADKMQISYYLYYLDSIGVYKTGTINYTTEKRVEEIELTEQVRIEVEDALKGIKNIINMQIPPKVDKLPYCKKCAYYQLCYISEGDY